MWRGQNHMWAHGETGGKKGTVQTIDCGLEFGPDLDWVMDRTWAENIFHAENIFCAVPSSVWMSDGMQSLDLWQLLQVNRHKMRARGQRSCEYRFNFQLVQRKAQLLSLQNSCNRNIYLSYKLVLFPGSPAFVMVCFELVFLHQYQGWWSQCGWPVNFRSIWTLHIPWPFYIIGKLPMGGVSQPTIR